jgi:hypothetical protein
MGKLYASICGTAVIQLKDIPKRPPEYNGKLCLFGLDKNLVSSVDEKVISAITLPMEDRGIPLSLPAHTLELKANDHGTALDIVKEVNEAVKKNADKLKGFCVGINTIYNQTCYDDDVSQRVSQGLLPFSGWCTRFQPTAYIALHTTAHTTHVVGSSE